MPQLDFTTYSSQIFWFLICFSILYFFLSKIILPRIGEIIKNRQDLIEENITKSEKLQKEIDELTNINNELRKNANNQYKLKIDEVKKEAQQNRQKLIDEMKSNIENTTNDSRLKLREFLGGIDNKAQTAITNLTKQIRDKLIG